MVPNKIKVLSEDFYLIDNNIYQGCYISYNRYDLNLYGDVTTALVFGQAEIFLILNGNHFSNYLYIHDPFKCVEYFQNNLSSMNKYSNKVPKEIKIVNNLEELLTPLNKIDQKRIDRIKSLPKENFYKHYKKVEKRVKRAEIKQRWKFLAKVYWFIIMEDN